MSEETATLDEPTTTTTPTEEEAPSSFVEAALKAMEGEPEAKEPEPEPEAKEESKEEAKEEPKTEELTKESRSASDFKLVKQRAKEAEGEVDRLKAEIEALKSSEPQSSTELERLRQERDELSSHLKAASLERHPEFAQHYQTRLESIVERAKSVAGSEYSERVELLLKMPDSEYKTNALDEIFADLSVSKQTQLGALITQMDEVVHDRDAKLKDANQTYQQIVESQQAKQANWIKESESTFSKVGESAKDWFVFQERENDDDWNKSVAERRDVAKNIFLGESTQEQLATAAYMASAADFLYDTLTKELEAHSLTKQQLKELQGANPSVNSDGTKQPNKPVGFIEAVKAQLEG